MSKKNDFGALFSDSSNSSFVLFNNSNEEILRLDSSVAIIIGILSLVFVFWLLIIFIVLLLAGLFYFEIHPKAESTVEEVKKTEAVKKATSKSKNSTK